MKAKSKIKLLDKYSQEKEVVTYRNVGVQSLFGDYKTERIVTKTKLVLCEVGDYLEVLHDYNDVSWKVVVIVENSKGIRFCMNVSDLEFEPNIISKREEHDWRESRFGFDRLDLDGVINQDGIITCWRWKGENIKENIFAANDILNSEFYSEDTKKTIRFLLRCTK